MRRAAPLLLIWLCGCFGQSEDLFEISGYVADEYGYPFSGAKVQLQRDNGFTDAFGPACDERPKALKFECGAHQ